MIRIDRYVCRDILKVTRDYQTQIVFAPDLGGFGVWIGCRPNREEVIPTVNVSEVPGSLERLIDRGLINKIQGLSGGGMIFTITPELLHAKAFWWDRFTKVFWGGFVIGVVTGLLANLLTAPVQSLISELLRLLLAHI